LTRDNKDNGDLTLRSDKIEISGLIVLFIGVILLAATFYSAYTFLSQNLAILTSTDIMQLFGNALAPLIEAIIRILFLGIMGWIGSIITIRAVQLLKREKEITPTQSQAKPEANQAPTPAPARVEPKKAEAPVKNPPPDKPATPTNEAQSSKPAEKAAESGA
jgi:hypothetical protein